MTKKEYQVLTGIILLALAAILIASAFGLIFGLAGFLISIGIVSAIYGAVFISNGDDL